jgi:hypothetical protein
MNSTYQTISEVYSTEAAITMVRIRPGTRPRTEYDHGKDMIARQMYSEKSSAAVYVTSSALIRFTCWIGEHRPSANYTCDT